jgi:hypothetical protein
LKSYSFRILEQCSHAAGTFAATSKTLQRFASPVLPPLGWRPAKTKTAFQINKINPLPKIVNFVNF